MRFLLHTLFKEMFLEFAVIILQTVRRNCQIFGVARFML